MTGFSDEEENDVGMHEDATLIEKEMVAQGGEYSKAEMAGAHAVLDGTLVTGQNPASSKLCVENSWNFSDQDDASERMI